VASGDVRSKRIDLELGWAEATRLNTMRVFLHDLPWKQDAAGFTKRLDTFLAIAAKHHIRPVLVLFDSVWDPNPKLGPQAPPRPGVHNSRWLQSPGAKALEDRSEYPRLEAYVRGVVGKFGHDERVLAWTCGTNQTTRMTEITKTRRTKWSGSTNCFQGCLRGRGKRARSNP